jgi:hypothetical protein
MRTFEIVLRRPNATDRVRYDNRVDAEIGDVVMVDGRPWVIIEKDPPFELRRIDRIICVPAIREAPRLM